MQNTSLRSSLHGPVPLMLSAALCVVHFCRVVLSYYAVMQFLLWAGEHKMPLWAGSTTVALPMCWEQTVCGVCVLLPQSHWGCWLATQVHWLLWTGLLWSREDLFICSVLHLAVSHDWVLYAAPVTSGNEFFSLSLECLKLFTCLMLQ